MLSPEVVVSCQYPRIWLLGQTAPLISYSPYRRDITFKPEIKKGFQFASDPEEEDEPRELKACAVIEPVQARRYLKHVGLDYESPPRAPPRFEQGEFDFEPNDWSSEHLS
ncbi:MAG: hypothetical protein RL011_302 [Pseudomonadota bacterium]|jgi:hypothetical protein